MSGSRLLFVSLCLILFCALLGPRTMADEWNQATKVTFSGPVEVPGAVLRAGTYWFSLMNDDTDRNIVQIWNADRMHLLATILTVPNYRLQATGKTVIKFEERPSKQPEALRAWFYPDEKYGHEFVYPEAKAKELAKRVGQPVLSMRDELASNITKPAKSANDRSVVALKHAQVTAINPQGEKTAMANVVGKAEATTGQQR
jgi:hypothetical protein